MYPLAATFVLRLNSRSAKGKKPEIKNLPRPHPIGKAFEQKTCNRPNLYKGRGTMGGRKSRKIAYFHRKNRPKWFFAKNGRGGSRKNYDGWVEHFQKKDRRGGVQDREKHSPPSPKGVENPILGELHLLNCEGTRGKRGQRGGAWRRVREGR